MTRYALAYPNVRFKLTHDGNVTLQTTGDGDRRLILAALYGVEAAKQLLEITAEEQGIRLSGLRQSHRPHSLQPQRTSRFSSMVAGCRIRR